MAATFKCASILTFHPFLDWKIGTHICAGTRLLRSPDAHSMLLLPTELKFMGISPFIRQNKNKICCLGKKKIKRSRKCCSHKLYRCQLIWSIKLKLLEGEQLGWHCRTEPSQVLTCRTALKPNVHCHESHLWINGLWQASIQETNTSVKEGSWQRDFTPKNFWTECLKFPFLDA